MCLSCHIVQVATNLGKIEVKFEQQVQVKQNCCETQANLSNWDDLVEWFPFVFTDMFFMCSVFDRKLIIRLQNKQNSLCLPQITIVSKILNFIIETVSLEVKQP